MSYRMGSDQRFSLKWNNYQTHLVTAFESLLEQKDFVDVTLGVEGRKLAAHKMLLSACSPYFRELLKGNPCQHPIIILRDIPYDDLFSLLQFMYNGEVNVAQDQLNSFLKSAESLKIRGLTDNEGGGDGNDSGSNEHDKGEVSKTVFKPPTVKKKRLNPADSPSHSSTPTPSVALKTYQPTHQVLVSTPVVKQHIEPVKQEIIELSDEQYEDPIDEQYTDTSQAYEEPRMAGEGVTMTTDQSGMGEMQGFRNQGTFNNSTKLWDPRDEYGYQEESNFNYHGDLKEFEGQFTCSTCGKIFSTARSLKNHMAVHDSGRTLTCSECGKPQSSSTNYTRHLKTVHGIEKEKIIL